MRCLTVRLERSGMNARVCNSPASAGRSLASRYAGMTNFSVNLLSLALIFVAASLNPAAAQPRGSGDIPIVDASRTAAATKLIRDLGRPFEPPRPCEVRQPRATVREVLGASVKAIRVHHYDKPAWRNITVVGDYIRRVLDARPEGGSEGGGLQPSVYWAEASRAEVVGSIEFSSGRLSRIELASGYVHVEDGAGCQWWGRYLGGDRRAWVVRE
jgi:hypothetical protein